MKRWQKNYLILSGCICVFGFRLLYLKNEEFTLDGYGGAFEKIQELSEQLYFPYLFFASEQEERKKPYQWIAENVMHMVPLGNYIVQMEKDEMEAEDEETYALLVQRQENDENEIDSSGNLIGKDYSAETLQASVSNESLSIEKLSSMDYLVSNFYTIDSVTYLYEGVLDATHMMAMDLTIKEENQGPKILIFHTHSQEAFINSDGTAATSIVGIGSYLSQILNKT